MPTKNGNENIMTELNLTVRDFYIKKIKTKEGEREVIQLRDAFDENFIEDMRAKGVRTYIERNKEEDEDEDENDE